MRMFAKKLHITFDLRVPRGPNDWTSEIMKDVPVMSALGSTGLLKVPGDNQRAYNTIASFYSEVEKKLGKDRLGEVKFDVVLSNSAIWKDREKSSFSVRFHSLDEMRAYMVSNGMLTADVHARFLAGDTGIKSPDVAAMRRVQQGHGCR